MINEAENGRLNMLMKKLFAAAFAGGLMVTAGAALAQTVGPQGETATPSSTLTLSDADISALKDKGYKAAFLWHTSSDFTNAVTAGATDEFARAGITIAVKTDAQFDAARQRSDIETALAAKPNIILALPVDPITA